MVKRFYLYKERVFKSESELKARFLGPSDMKHIETPGNSFWKLMGEMMAGNKCIGLIKDGGVVSYLWVDEKFIQYHGITRKLKKNEAYLYNANTKLDLKGNGYAGILRAKVYEILSTQGRDVFYSFTDLSNAPAIKFKEKIGAKIIEEYFYFKLWNIKYLKKL